MSEQPCACKIQRRGDEIDFMEIAFCPLHQAAGELLEACKELCRVFASEPRSTLQQAISVMYDKCRIAVAHAEGTRRPEEG